MSEENKKLQNVKKSCKAAKIVSLFLCIVCTVGCALTLLGGLILLCGGEKVNREIEQAIASGNVEMSVSVGPFKVMDFDPNELSGTGQRIGLRMESSIPALNDYLQKQNTNYSLVYGFICILIAAMVGVLAVVMKLIHSIFVTIEKEETPFADAVLKKMLVALIIISVLLGVSIGTGVGVLAGFFTWAIYSIMDYGRALQITVDETL